MVSLFDWLLVSHLVGDFLLQSYNMAMRKAQDWSWMFRHIAAYTVVVTIPIVCYTMVHRVPGWLAIVAVLFIAGTHIVLDRRDFTGWWLQRVVRAPSHAWLPVVVDQVFHVVTLVVVAQALDLASR
jgi:hypothetical protein